MALWSLVAFPRPNSVALLLLVVLLLLLVLWSAALPVESVPTFSLGLGGRAGGVEGFVGDLFMTVVIAG